jgi:hypothetical protein
MLGFAFPAVSELQEHAQRLRLWLQREEGVDVLVGGFGARLRIAPDSHPAPIPDPDPESVIDLD